MAVSITFADETLVVYARMEAEIQSRSVAGQILHWARLGRAMERSGNFDHIKLSRALAGELRTAALTPEEKAVWSDRFLAKLSEPTLGEEAHFAKLRKSGKSIATNGTGKIEGADVKPDE
jgi:hypothetical protein